MGFLSGWKEKQTLMTNEQIVILKAISAITLFVLMLCVLLIYLYHQLIKDVLKSFKTKVVALLVLLGIIDEMDNDSGHTT